MAPRDAPPLPDDSIEYFDEALDVAHDDEGYLEQAFIEAAHRRTEAWEHLEPAPAAFWMRVWWQARWAIFAAAFALPMLVIGATFGVFALLHDDSPPDAAAVIPLPTAELLTPQWTPGLVFALHSVPARIRNTLSAPGEQHGYAFEGQAGMTWTFTVAPYDNSGVDVRLMLYDPTGASACPPTGCAAGVPLTVALPQSGTYRAVIDSASGAGVGLYLLTVDVARVHLIAPG